MPELPKTMTKYFHCEVLECAPIARAAGDAAAADGEPADDVISIVISTETPCETWFGYETLSHESAAIDMSLARTGLSAYLEHGGWPFRPTPDPGLHVGIVENIRLEGKKLMGDYRASQHPLAQQTKRSLLDGTLRYVSVRCMSLKRKVLSAVEKIGDVRKELVTRWRPEEVSFVGIPADPKAQVARSAGSDEYPVEYEFEESPNHPEEEPMPPVETPTPESPASPAASAAEPAGQATITRSAVAPNTAEILSLCDAQKVPIARAADFIKRGLTVDQVKSELFDDRITRGSALQPAAEVRLDAVPEKDRKRYSVARALETMVRQREGGGQLEGFEWEVSQEIARQAPKGYVGLGSGFFVPMDLMTREQREEANFNRSRRIGRAMGMNQAGGGAELVFDRAGDLIDLLRNRMLCAQFGAQVLSGLTGPVQFPVQTGDPTASLIAENPASAVAATQLTFGTRTLSPKEAVAVVPFPRRLLNTASIDIESRVRTTLIAKHSLLWDRLALHGKGTDGEPAGIYNTPGVGSVAFGGTVPTYGKIVDMGSAIADANADDDNMKYMTTPTMAGKLRQTVAFTNTAETIWKGKYRDGEMAGYGAGSTKQISNTLGAGSDEHGIIFGDWQWLVFGIWGALEFIVDTVTQAGKGQIIITTNQLGDNVVERPEAFAVATGAKIA